MTRRHLPRSPGEINYTAQRVVRALEVVGLAPASAPQVGEALGIHARTARRILGTLSDEQYVDYVIRPRGRRRHLYAPTLRLVALAAQIAERLPIVEHGRRTTAALHEELGLTTTLSIPCYTDVVIIARAGQHGPRHRALVPAGEHAAGRALLAHRDPWRHSHAGPLLTDRDAETICELGHASALRDGAAAGSIAVVVPDPDTAPIAALALEGPSDRLRDQTPVLIDPLTRAASTLAAQLS